MRFAIILSIVAASTSGCATVDCGLGTVEKNGTCVPANEVINAADCGSGTVLIGTECMPIVECDPDTTTAVPDPNDPNKTICVGTGGKNTPCTSTLKCPAPASGKQTICGQLYNIEDNTKFADAGADGTPCGSTPSASGPCALAIHPYDALLYGHDQTIPPLDSSGTYIDNCGRYQVKDITQPSTPFIGLGIDDAVGSNGPNGVTNTTGVATTASADTKTVGLEAWVAPKSTTDMWTASMGPPVSGGIYVAIFRKNKCITQPDDTIMCLGDGEEFEDQPGVKITLSGSTLPNNDYYFMSSQATHQTIDPNATVTGVNGTGLLTGASVDNLTNYSGTGGIADTTTCKWENHAAASLPNIVFFQVYRPFNQVGKQCLQ